MNVPPPRASLVPIMALLSRLVLAAAAAAVIVQGQIIILRCFPPHSSYSHSEMLFIFIILESSFTTLHQSKFIAASIAPRQGFEGFGMEKNTAARFGYFVAYCVTEHKK